MQRRKSNMLWILLASGVIVNLIIFGIVIFPEIQSDYKLTNAISELERQRKEVKQQTRTENIELSDFTPLLKRIPLERNHFDFLSAFEQFANDSQVIIQSMKYRSREEQAKELQGLDVAILSESIFIEIKGPYDGIRSFLKSIEQMDRIIHVTQVEMSDAGQLAGDDPEWSFQYEGAEEKPLIFAALTLQLFSASEESNFSKGWAFESE